MKVIFSSKDINASEEKKEYAQNVFDRFDKFFKENEASCKVTLKHVKDRNITVDVVLSVIGCPDYRASATEEKYTTAIDAVYEKLKKQIRREKDKTVENSHKGRSKELLSAESEAESA